MREMKDSGIPWIGKIPKEWKIIHLKYLCSFKTGGTPANKIGINEEKNGIPWLTPEDIAGEIDIIPGRQYISKHIVAKNKYAIFPKGSTLLVCIASVGKTGYLTFPAYSNQQITALRPKVDLIKDKFLTYSILSFSKQISFDASSNVVPIVNTKYLSNFSICLPNKYEQQRIADYLDTKCARIDSIRKNVEAEIEALKQYKQAVITEAVTKGLDKNVEMKDSGIPWIGKIPKNWKTIRIGRIFKLRNERNHLSKDKVQLLSLYAGKGVFPTGSEGTINSGNHAQTVYDYKIVKKDDIVVNIILAWMGSLGISEYNGVVSPAYDVYIPDKTKVYPRYYHYVMRTSGIASECYRYGRGIMMMRWRTYSSEFKKINVPFPAMSIQIKIANYLNAKCLKIDSIIQKKQELLTKLDTYKKSLIYEYVTGKKEVPAV